MKFFIAILVYWIVFATSPAQASGICYSSDEAAAEAAVRLHSELLVIALTCQYGPGGVDLQQIYNSFGRRHNARLRAAEQTLMEFHENNGDAGAAAIDELRTRLGNELSGRAATMDPQIYCRQFAGRLMQAAGWTPQQFESVIAQVQRGRGSYPVCR